MMMFYNKNVHAGLKNGDTYFAEQVSEKLFLNKNTRWMRERGVLWTDENAGYEPIAVPFAKAKSGYGVIQIKKDDISFKDDYRDLIDNMPLYDLTFGDAHRRYEVKYTDANGEVQTDILSARHIADYYAFNKNAYFDGFAYENQSTEKPLKPLLEEGNSEAFRNLLKDVKVDIDASHKKIFDDIFVRQSSYHGFKPQFNICFDDLSREYGNRDGVFDLRAFTDDAIKYYDAINQDMKDRFSEYKDFLFTNSNGVSFDDIGSKKYQKMYRESFIDGVTTSQFVKTGLVGIAIYKDSLQNDLTGRFLSRSIRSQSDVAGTLYDFGEGRRKSHDEAAQNWTVHDKYRKMMLPYSNDTINELCQDIVNRRKNELSRMRERERGNEGNVVQQQDYAFFDFDQTFPDLPFA